MSLMHVPAFAQLEHLVSRETFDPRDGSAQIYPHQSSRQHQESQDDGHQQATAWVRAAMKLMAMVDVKGSHLTMKSDVFVAAAAGTPNRAKHARWSYLVYAPLRLSLRRQVHQRAPAERRGQGAGEDVKWEQSVRQRLCVRACGQCILSTAGSKKWGRGGGGASLALVSRPAASARVRSRSEGGGATRKLVRQATSRTWRTTLNSERVCVCVCVGVTTHGSRRAHGSSTI